MKRVSFEVAKALKEADYPQDEYGHHYYLNGVSCYGVLEDNNIYAPTYLDVWLWLWREKKSIIQVLFDGEWYCQSTTANQAFSSSDPEEAIIAAIEYLVDNNLIK